MAEELEPKYQVLRQWLKEPAVEHNVWTLGSYVGLTHVVTMRVMAELLRDGFIQGRRGGLPRAFYLSDAERARDTLRSLGVRVQEGA